ncbi:phospholipase A1 member A-like isoform X2 [Cylas formicarius]|uniref:phospholipase A1 member A-like isoform X2 n=1 Tax=Cylas formicarius TaxID=197179 RepID=UPI002958574E|nr:phospholipase A1 member A-like isoform X2 [Cylas formicarius]
MNAAGTAIGVTILTVTAVFAFIKLLQTPNGHQTKGNNTYQLIDPAGPDIQFVLFTRNNSPCHLRFGDHQTLNTSGFSGNRETKIITHGFLSSIENDVFVMSRDDTGDYNVIGMDWSVLCRMEYVSAMRGAKTAGRRLGEFINFLARNGVSLNSVHLIGHSLGAHVVAIAGDAVKGGRVARITGLDPAGIGYGDIRQDMKWDRGDAQLVDVIHTYLKLIGAALPLGHVDFYPNGGQTQPGCPYMTGLNLPDAIYCNHGRSHQLFVEAIRNPKAFRSKKCRNLENALTGRCFENTDVYMGQPDTYRPGLYYFTTRDTPPYSMEGKQYSTAMDTTNHSQSN